MRRDPQDNARVLYQIAAAQGGYFTAAQARQAGYAYSQQHFHLARGNWLKVERGLFRLRDYPASEREDLIRATAARLGFTHIRADARETLKAVIKKSLRKGIFKKEEKDNIRRKL